MPKFYRNVKTGQVISEDQYKERLLETTKTASWEMASAGMNLFDYQATGSQDLEEYVPEEKTQK